MKKLIEQILTLLHAWRMPKHQSSPTPCSSEERIPVVTEPVTESEEDDDFNDYEEDFTCPRDGLCLSCSEFYYCEGIKEKFYEGDYMGDLYDEYPDDYYFSECRWDDDCGSCPYFNRCLVWC